MLHYARLERLARDKPFSLFGSFINYVENELFKYDPWSHIKNTSISSELKKGPNKLECYVTGKPLQPSVMLHSSLLSLLEVTKIKSKMNQIIGQFKSSFYDIPWSQIKLFKAPFLILIMFYTI